MEVLIIGKKEEQQPIYIIPNNFIEPGRFFGGMLKVRNAFEGGVLAAVIGYPILKIPISFTAQIVILCFTALPAAILGLIGVSGDSLSTFVINFFKYLLHRRIIKRGDVTETMRAIDAPVTPPTRKMRRQKRIAEQKEQEVSDEFSDDEKKKHARGSPAKAARPKKKEIRLEDYLPIKDIKDGIIQTKDNRYIKILEVEPINFLLRSAREQKNIIYSFASYLKISPVRIQFKVLTRRADINKHLSLVQKEAENETDEKCRCLQEDYIELIRRIGSREAVSRRFFVIFEYESITNRKNTESEIITMLKTAERSLRTYLRNCGNEVKTTENEDEFAIEVLYSLLNRKSSITKPLQERVQELIGRYTLAGREDQLNSIPANEFIAPQSIDFTHSRYVVIDGVYHSYLYVPAAGYKTEVYAGWISLIVNAGEGIDVDIYLHRQPKDRIQQKLGQQIRINRSKIRDTSDTNADFDGLDSAIQSGYYLKNGLSNNEDFYYLSILVTITAETVPDLEWRVGEMKKLMISQDMNIHVCNFEQEQAFLSALPLINVDKQLYSKMKRNLLTSAAASCYPFVSYEVSDDNGILLGTNKHNNSLVIVDIFNTELYKNAVRHVPC